MTKAPRRETYHHGDLRNALVVAAADLVAGASPEELTLREVARRVGVNHRAAYRHFADKIALLAAVAELGYGELVAAMEAALAPLGRATPERRLSALAIAYVAFAVDHPAHYRIMFGRRLNEDGRFPELEAHAARAFALVLGEIEKGQRAGRLAHVPVREAAFSFWALAHGFASLALARRIKVKRALLESYAAQILAPLLAGLARR